MFGLMSLISDARSREFINVKVAGTKDCDLLVERILTHKKSLCAEHAEANSERNLYAPPLGLG